MCRLLGIYKFFKVGEKFRLRRYQRKTMPPDKNVQIWASGVNHMLTNVGVRNLPHYSLHQDYIPSADGPSSIFKNFRN